MSDEQGAAKEARTAYETGERGGATASIPEEQYVVDSKGKRIGVILPFEQYQQMREDLHDLAAVAERREESTISLEDMKQRLEEDGLL
jgi:hypothetical protein